MALGEKAGSRFFTATDVANVVLSPEMQAQFTQVGIHKMSISVSTAWHWLSKLGWRYGRHQPVCMWMAMNMRTSWNISKHLLKDSKFTNSDFTPGTTQGISSLTLQASLCPVQPNTPLLFTSPMTNLSSIKMTNNRLTGVALAVELQDQREKALPL